MAVKKSNKQLSEEVESLTTKLESFENLIKKLQDKIEQLTIDGKTKAKKEVSLKVSKSAEGGLKLNCEKCNFSCTKKIDLKKHVQDKHREVQKEKNCRICGEVFAENYELENHLRSHQESERFRCDQCGKVFYLEWRLKKHSDVHKTTKYCHYYNNGKTCPFELIGCKFKHEQSPICKFKVCYNRLCQFRHNLDEVEQEQSNNMISMPMETSTVEESVSEIEEDSLDVSGDYHDEAADTTVDRDSVRTFDCETCDFKSESYNIYFEHINLAHEYGDDFEVKLKSF